MDENLVTPKKGNIVWIYSVSWYVQNGFEITLFDLYPVTMISMVNIVDGFCVVMTDERNLISLTKNFVLLKTLSSIVSSDYLT